MIYPMHNVLSETFCQTLAPSIIPIADEQMIRRALIATDLVNRSYRNDETATSNVPEQWHKNVMLEFADWLSAHIPESSHELLCHKFGDISMIGQLIRYQAENAIDAFQSIASDISEDESGRISATAQTMAELICQLNGTKTVNIVLGEGQVFSFFVPSYNEYKGSFEDLEEYTRANLCAQTAAWYECHMAVFFAVAAALTLDETAISICCNSEPGKSELVVMTCIDGQVVMVNPSVMQSIIGDDANETNVALIEENLSGFAPQSEFEYRSMMLSASIIVAIQCVLANAKSNAAPTENDGEESSEMAFSMYSTPLTTETSNGNAVFSVPSELSDKPYIDLYDGIMDIDRSVTPVDATRLLVAMTMERAAEEIISTGSVIQVGDDVADMFQSLEIGMAMIEYDEAGMIPLHEFAEAVAERKELALCDELFGDLPKEKQETVDTLLKVVLDDPDNQHVMLSMDNKKDYDGTFSPRTTMVPPHYHERARDSIVSALRSIATKAVLSDDATMVITTIAPDSPNVVAASMLSFSNGEWRNQNIDSFFDFLDNFPLDSTLMIANGDAIVYRNILQDGTTQEVQPEE